MFRTGDEVTRIYPERTLFWIDVCEHNGIKPDSVLTVVRDSANGFVKLAYKGKVLRSQKSDSVYFNETLFVPAVIPVYTHWVVGVVPKEGDLPILISRTSRDGVRTYLKALRNLPGDTFFSITVYRSSTNPDGSVLLTKAKA